MQPLLSLKDIRFRYNEDIPLIEDLQLDLLPGEVLWLAGANGTGKSTLAKILMGLLRLQRGQIFLAGKDVTSEGIDSRAGTVGFALQNPDLQLFSQTIEKELTFGCENLGLDETEIKHRLKNCLEYFHLNEIRDEPPMMQTFHIRKWIAMASVIMMAPKLYLLDEPDWTLDRHGRLVLKEFIEGERNEGKAFIVISHNPEYMSSISDRCLLLEKGGKWSSMDPESMLYDTAMGEALDLIQSAKKFKLGRPITPQDWAQRFLARRNEK